jgi:glutathione S-transferase
MKLYYAPGACSQAPHIVIHELGLPYEAVKVDLVKHALPDGSDYRAINPKGYVPLLELDDGTRLTEASVLVQYLADQRPGVIAPKFGTLERWKLMEWLGFISTEIHKGFGPLWKPQTPAEVREATIAALGNRFSYISKTLEKQPYLMGNDFTVADAYLFVVTNWSKVHKVDLSRWPAVQQFLDRVAARPKVQETLRAEGLLDKARKTA